MEIQEYKAFKETIYKKYMKEVDDIFELCDWKTHLSPEEVVGIVLSITMKELELSGMLKEEE